MSERLITVTRPNGQQILTCDSCVKGYRHQPYIGRTDPLGLWLFCRACHAERLWTWAAIGSTLVSFCGSQVARSLLAISDD